MNQSIYEGKYVFHGGPIQNFPVNDFWVEILLGQKKFGSNFSGPKKIRVTIFLPEISFPGTLEVV